MIFKWIENGLVGLLAVAGFALWIYTGLHPHEIKPFLLNGAYYAILTLFLVWLYTVLKYLQSIQFSPVGFLRQYGGGVLFCLLATLMIEVSVKPSFKTLSDETNLLVTSRAMTFERTVASEVMAVRYYGEFNPIAATNTIDKRPFLFPFLESVLHVLRGFGPTNAFLLNGLLTFIFLSTVFIGTRQFLNGPLSLAAVVLVMSYPVFSICATSGGFDLLSSTYLGLSLVILYSFLRGPTTEKFALLWMTLMMLSQTRHESLMYFFIVLGFLIVMGRIAGSYWKENRLVLAMTPLWFLLSVWGPLVNFQLVEDPMEKDMFALRHFEHNSLDFIKGLAKPDFAFPYDNILSLIAGVLLVYLVLRCVVRKRIAETTYQSRFMFILSACALASVVVPLSFYGGMSLHPAGVRLFLPVSIECALIPILWLVTLAEESLAKISKPFLLGSIGLFLLYHPIAVEGRFVNSSYPYRETSFELGIVQNLFPDQKILVVAEIPSQFTALQYGAIDFKTANDNIPNFLAGLQRHMYNEIIVIQRIAYAGGGVPTPKNVLSPSYRLETLTEYETDPGDFIRISRVKLG